MPIFEYHCAHCGLSVEKIQKASVEHIECPSCGKESNKVISDFGFAFKNGKVNGNSGVDSLDSSIDKIVGRDAEMRWEHVKDRESYKKKIEGQVQRTSEGYKPLSDSQAKRREYLLASAKK